MADQTPSPGRLSRGLLHGSPGRLDAAVLAAGLLAPLAFAPFKLWPMGPVSLAILFVSWLRATPARAAWRGWLYGAGMLGTGVFWIHESFRFQHVALWLAVLLTGLLVLAMALYPALTGWLTARQPGAARWRLLMLFPLAWTLQEWLRSWLFTGFPWLMAGYAQVEGPLAGWAPVSGVLGVTALTALAGGVLAGLALWPRRPVAPLAVLGLVAGGGWLMGTVQWTTVVGEPFAVALIQGNVPQDQKWLASRRQPTLDHYLEATRAQRDAALILWPETAVPALYHDARDYLARLARWSRTSGRTLILGIPYQDGGGGLLYNSVLTYAPGEQVYHKRHLVPFGEYVPFREILEPPMRALGLPLPAFRGGPTDQALAEVDGHPVGITVCYEGAFGELVRSDLPTAELLVNLSNDAWFGRSIGPPQHLQMVRMRALETGRYLLRATNTGITAIIGPRGEVVERVPQFETTVLEGEARWMTGATPYVRWGEWPVLVLVLAGLLFVRQRSPDGAG